MLLTQLKADHQPALSDQCRRRHLIGFLATDQTTTISGEPHAFLDSRILDAAVEQPLESPAVCRPTFTAFVNVVVA